MTRSELPRRKTRTHPGPAVLAAVLAAAPAWAETGRQDTSGIFVWAFLGLCALIVVAQLIPAALMLLGAARGMARGIGEGRRRPAGERARSR